MGGLDARMMLFRFRMEDRVASLTTIGTPHTGTPYADWGIKRLGWLLPVAGRFNLNLKGFADLTTAKCLHFNRITSSYERRNGVLYQTLAGAQPIERIYLPLRFPYRIISRLEGENDGLVPLSSAIWRKRYHLATIDADHLNQIGWWDRGEARSGLDREAFEAAIRRVYLEIADGLVE
jgi:triacylglycerol lipase